VVPSARRQPALDTFVVGASNRMGFAAIELAANRPGEMSPLFLHGPSGVGKTHLLESFCDAARARHPGIATVFLSAEQFTTGFLQALHGSGLPGFRRSCRQADMLVIDDLQFFVGKRATVVEFQQTIDAVMRHGRQMVFAADRDLDALGELGPELLARLKGGMQARILPPDEDVRRGIVSGLSARRGLAMPPEVIDYVATHITRHARELIGAVNRLEAASHMLGLPITPDMAAESLVDLVRSSRRGVRLADIERAICTAFGIEAGSLQSARRSRSVNHPRMLAMFLARKHTSSALTEIGRYFGRRSHSTVITAQKTVTEWLSRQESVRLADASWEADEAIRRVEDLLRVG
jgi:chromosomal replication initiator protein